MFLKKKIDKKILYFFRIKYIDIIFSFIFKKIFFENKVQNHVIFCSKPLLLASLMSLLLIVPYNFISKEYHLYFPP